jgi:hypothetical protein
MTDHRHIRYRHIRDLLRDTDLSGHDWIDIRWHDRPAQLCGRCGYLWKPDMATPSRDCARFDRFP